MKRALQTILLKFCRTFGTKVYDAQSGEMLGRCMMISWKGRMHIIGAESHWVPVPLPQKRMTYWKQEIGFTCHPTETPPRSTGALNILSSSSLASSPPRILVAVLDHRSPNEVNRILSHWMHAGVAKEDLLLLYGGQKEGFAAQEHQPRFLLKDSRLQTRDHQREGQSYRSAFRAVDQWLQNNPHTHILFMEGDHVPVDPDVLQQYLKTMQEEDADVLGYAVQRIDGTIHPHWLGTESNTYATQPMWSMLGTGHFWKREVWGTVTRDERCAGWYLEMDLATSVVQNGFRLIGLTDQDRFVMNLPERLPCPWQDAGSMGAWTVHPVKDPGDPI